MRAVCLEQEKDAGGQYHIKSPGGLTSARVPGVPACRRRCWWSTTARACEDGTGAHARARDVGAWWYEVS